MRDTPSIKASTTHKAGAKACGLRADTVDTVEALEDGMVRSFKDFGCAWRNSLVAPENPIFRWSRPE
jgi:hypothetical protein